MQANSWTPSPLLECSPCILALQPVPHPFHYQSHAFSGGTWQTLPRSHHLLPAESFRTDGPWQQIQADVEAGVSLGRDGADQDVIATTPQTMTKTRSVRNTAHEWVAEDILAIEIGPWNTSSRLESKLRVRPLRGLLPRHILDADRDLDAEAVAGIPDATSETESTLRPIIIWR